MCENRVERYLSEGPPRRSRGEDPSVGGKVDVPRRTVGIILLASGLVMMASYFVLTQTDVGPIAELVGVGFCFMFLGLLTTIGELSGLYSEEDR